MTHPSIDHTLLSPSGRVSKRARADALARETARLFPPGYWDEPSLTDAEKAHNRAATLRRSADNLDALADRGMSPKKHRKAARALRAEASAIQGP